MVKCNLKSQHQRQQLKYVVPNIYILRQFYTAMMESMINRAIMRNKILILNRIKLILIPPSLTIV
jgi:hypothetical protein